MRGLEVRRLELSEAGTAAQIHRAALDARLPWLAGIHRPDEDARYFHDQVFRDCAVYGAALGSATLGIVAFREDWIDQLHVRPEAQGKGVGTALLRVAQAAFPRLHLWTFQRNTLARRFYEAHGFLPLQETDGSRNEQKEPDVLYLWEPTPAR